MIAVAILLYAVTIRPEKHGLLTVWTSTKNDVEVRIDVVRRPSGQLHLMGTFTPTREGFQLYSKDLPKDGLNGLGRPTLLEVAKSDSVEVTGPLEANRPVQDIYVGTLDLSFPVYPAGPVTLSLPFEFVGNGDLISMEMSITYMACSDKVCLPPVIDKHIFIKVPAGFFDD
jgi:hypothetical protein